MTPEFYDGLFSTRSNQVNDHSRREGDQLATRVFEDASYAAARIAGDPRKLARGEAVYVPGDKTLNEPSASPISSACRWSSSTDQRDPWRSERPALDGPRPRRWCRATTT